MIGNICIKILLKSEEYKLLSIVFPKIKQLFYRSKIMIKLNWWSLSLTTTPVPRLPSLNPFLVVLCFSISLCHGGPIIVMSLCPIKHIWIAANTHRHSNNMQILLVFFHVAMNSDEPFISVFCLQKNCFCSASAFC